MAKFFNIKLIATFLIGILLSSCKSEKENFDLDFSSLKIPNKTAEKITNPGISDSSKTNYKITKNLLNKYQTKSEILNSVILGKIDPFSKTKEDIKVNNLTFNLKLTGFLSTEINKYVFVSYLGSQGTITEESIGGINTTLLPDGAKVMNIDPENFNLIINFENKNYTFEL